MSKHNFKATTHNDSYDNSEEQEVDVSIQFNNRFEEFEEEYGEYSHYEHMNRQSGLKKMRW